MTLEHEIERFNPKTQALRMMKMRASGLLIAVTIVFVISRYLEMHGHPGFGWLRAMAEAGMVGGLADWFAVTALFRYPLKIRFPHTAIIPNKKDEIGESLAKFVKEEFLTGQVVSQGLQNVNVAKIVGNWLSQEKNSSKVAKEISQLIKWFIESDRDNELTSTVVESASHFLRGLDVGKPLGELLADAIEKNAQDPLVENILLILEKHLINHESTAIEFLSDLTKRVPGIGRLSWFRNKSGEKIYQTVVETLQEMQSDPTHEFRILIDDALIFLANSLQEDPQLNSRLDGLKLNFVDSSSFKKWLVETWENLKTRIYEGAEDESSPIRTSIQRRVQSLGEEILKNSQYQERINRTTEELVTYVLTNYGKDAASLISNQIKSWSTTETTKKIEIQIGRDLQWIRINGTVVGSIAGLAIYAFGQLIS